MSRLLIVSNRLPVTVERRKGEYRFRRSVGGVATGLDSYRKNGEALWIGWAETPATRVDAEDRKTIRDALRRDYDSEPVFLTADDLAGFYHGFSNRTLWPLFHYFSRYAEFKPDFWRAYERVNRKYRDAVLEVYEPGDRIWVHDYQLMLLPGMLRKKLPDASIGFFLHIPFPSFELFRLLPWRRELLEGLLGANLIGFHTHDYVRHFLSSVHSLLGLEDRFGMLCVNNRQVLVDAFPMGIDFNKYNDASRSPAVQRERLPLTRAAQRIILSIDRLDYTKGVPDRLRAFDAFLERYPEWRGRVTLVCVAVPSRSRVWTYRQLKREVDELVGDINGRWGTLEWSPVQYLYRSLPFNQLVGVYTAADVALVTPLRDGMNLIAKEYVATHSDRPGVLVLSEMAGAARELAEAILVNPHDQEQVVEAMNEALTMSVGEQVRRNAAMRRRLTRYDVTRWAEDFLGKLEEVMMHQLAYDEYVLTPEARSRITATGHAASRRLFVLDYDGTLVGFSGSPEDAVPDEPLKELVAGLLQDGVTDVVIASGRDRDTLEQWLGDTGVALIAEHGAWLREQGGEWATGAPLSIEWKELVRSLLELYVDRTPGSFVEEKTYSLAWHYRNVAADLGRRRAQELTEALAGFAQSFNLSLLDGNRVIEIKSAGVDKGATAHRWMAHPEYDFVFVMGDDVTDEDLFAAAPPNAWTIKVGHGATRAMFDVSGPAEARQLLADLVRSRVPGAGKTRRSGDRKRKRG